MLYLIICPLVFLAGFVDAVAGGGGLISLPAYLIAGLPTHQAIGTNKLSSFMGTSLATFRYARMGYIPWKESVLCILAAMIGSSTGSNLALMVSDRYFKMVMLVLLPLTLLYVLSPRSLKEYSETVMTRRMVALAVAAALIIGVYDGFYGPGTGTFLLLLLTSVAHLNIRKANGLTKIINLTTNVSALAVYLCHGKVLLVTGLIAGVFGVAGNYIGTKCFDRGGSKAVKSVMVLVMVIFFVKVLLEVI